MDVLDDLELIPVVQHRIASWQADPDNVIEVTREELEKIARATPARRLQPRTSKKTLARAL